MGERVSEKKKCRYYDSKDGRVKQKAVPQFGKAIRMNAYYSEEQEYEESLGHALLYFLVTSMR